MANKQMFSNSLPGSYVPPADTKNEAGGKAYAYTPEQALAQYACTGTLNGSFYVGGEQTLETVRELCQKVDPEFIAATAVYARQKSFMKDMPSLLMAILAEQSKAGVRDAAGYMRRAAPLVIDNGRMLRNFVQMVRSGRLGRKSFGSAPRSVVAQYLLTKHPMKLFKDSVGNDPSLADCIRLGRPKPPTPEREALFRYLIGKPLTPEQSALLPAGIRNYEVFKNADPTERAHHVEVPDVEFRLIDSLVTDAQWKAIAKNASWHMTRMNLNTFARHKVFEDQEIVSLVAKRLKDRDAIRAAKVFPYQLMQAWLNVGEVPHQIKDALQEAMEISTENVEPLGRGAIAVDVSGSMSQTLMGRMPQGASWGAIKAHSQQATVLDVAALFGAVLLRKEPQTIMLPFDTSVYVPNRGNVLNPRDSIPTLARQLMQFRGGGTNCALPLIYLLEKKVTGLEYVLYLSDQESWVDSEIGTRMGGTQVLQLWEKLKSQGNFGAKLICCNLAVSGSSQAPTRRDVLNIGGFSDDVFRVAKAFMNSTNSPDHWVQEISKNWDLAFDPLAKRENLS